MTKQNKLLQDKKTHKHNMLYLAVLASTIVILGTVVNPAFASYNSYQSQAISGIKSGNTCTSINVAAVKGTIKVYDANTNPALKISSTSDHRDTFVYLVHPTHFDLGAGYRVDKTSSSTLEKKELVYYYKVQGSTLSHFTHNPWAGYSPVVGKVQQVSQGSGSWEGSVWNSAETVKIFSIAVTPGSQASNPSTGAVARTLNSVSSSSDNLPGHIYSIKIGYWSGGVLTPKLQDTNLCYSDHKCTSDDNWNFFRVADYYEIKTGPPVATSDNCPAGQNSGARLPGGE